MSFTYLGLFTFKNQSSAPQPLLALLWAPFTFISTMSPQERWHVLFKADLILKLSASWGLVNQLDLNMRTLKSCVSNERHICWKHDPSSGVLPSKKKNRHLPKLDKTKSFQSDGIESRVQNDYQHTNDFYVKWAIIPQIISRTMSAIWTKSST